MCSNEDAAEKRRGYSVDKQVSGDEIRMEYGIKTIDDFNVSGKTVLLRVDINQSVDKKQIRSKIFYD